MGKNFFNRYQNVGFDTISSMLTNSIFNLFLVPIKSEIGKVIFFTPKQSEIIEAMKLVIIGYLFKMENDYKKYIEEYKKRRI